MNNLHLTDMSVIHVSNFTTNGKTTFLYNCQENWAFVPVYKTCGDDLMKVDSVSNTTLTHEKMMMNVGGLIFSCGGQIS